MEIVFVFAAALVFLHLTNIWKSFAIPSCSLRPSRVPAILHSVLLLVCTVILIFVLTQWADREVRSDATWIFFYLAFSLALILAAQEIFALLGVSWRDDFVERRNVSAAIAVVGFTLGVTFCVAGANIGNGPGWWVVLVCAVLSIGALLGAWMTLNWIARVAETITIERDVDAGIRVGGFLVTGGIIFGISVSGDWQSVEVTVADFIRSAWPVAVLLIAVSIYERALQRRSLSKREPGIGISIAIAAAMIAAAAAHAKHAGVR